MATGNTTYEEALGLFTGITEITRNASRAARGLVSIQSRLTQVLDEQSSTGKALIDIYTDLGIELFDSNGQIRSLYDILNDLSRQWDRLSTNQKDYIALTQAGANQTQNFLSLMSNFETVVRATSTALNSTGSAAKENTRYMESLEAKTNQLKATFQDLSNNVIENELIKSLLDLANKALSALNTEVGAVITQFGLLSAGLIGFLGVGKYFLPLITGFIGGLGGWAVGIGAVVTGVYQLYKAWDEAHPTLEEINAQLSATQTQLQNNQARLEEISKIPWYDRTQEILDEEEALKQENEELQKNIDLLEERRAEATQKELGREVEVYRGKRYTTPNIQGTSGAVTYFETYEEALEALNAKYTEAQVKALNLADSIREVDNVTQESGYFLDSSYIDIMDKVIADLEDNNDLTKGSQQLYHQNIENIREQVQLYRSWAAQGNELTTSQQDLINKLRDLESAYQNAKAIAEKYSGALQLTKAQADQLKSAFPSLTHLIEQNGEAYYFLQSSAVTAANSIRESNGQLYQSDKTRVQETLKLLAVEAEARLEAYRLAKQEYETYETEENKQRRNQALTMWAEALGAQERLKRLISNTETLGWLEESPIVTRGGSSTKSSKSPEDLALKSFQSLYKDLQHQRDMDKISAEQYYAELEKLIANYTADATAHMKQYGLDTKTINQNMYQYEKEIYEGRKKLAVELAKKRQEDLNSQKSAYEALFSYMTDNIDKEIEALNKQRDSIVEYYDERIAKLQESNDEIERQIALEQKQDALARARQKKVLVYKDGRYQYVEDIDEVSAAKAELDAYEREEELRQETENLERLKETALDSIDAQIEKWEDYKNEWGSVVNEYQKEQNRLLILQELGIDIERDNWKKRLGNLEEFKDDYLTLVEEIRKAEEYAAELESAELAGSTGSTNRGFDSNIDYSLAILEAQKRGESDAVINKLKEERQNKIDAIYGGVDPASKELQNKLGYASGTLSASGGLSLVGENGPELRVLGHGDGIIPADITRNLWAWGSVTPAAMMSAFSGNFGAGKNMAVTIQNLNLPSVKDGNDFVQYMKNNFWRQTVQFATT